mmetsp:Transcript_5523/g.12600  ORF Transcript_5523/g.12600 Transcript_5523/m.12600 type:complete len:92 (-) Transcript_5523:41-316(-)
MMHSFTKVDLVQTSYAISLSGMYELDFHPGDVEVSPLTRASCAMATIATSLFARSNILLSIRSLRLRASCILQINTSRFGQNRTKLISTKP